MTMPPASPPGRFGPYGGRYVAETLIPALDELTEAFARMTTTAAGAPLLDEYRHLLATYVGRPTPLTRAERFAGPDAARVWLKREDLCHTGAHKINNCVGQALLARFMGNRRIIAETGAGQHGVATATVAARFGLPCRVYMGAEDVRRQALNVFRMRLLGAEVVAVESGTRTLKDAMNEALRDWVTNVADTYYLIGSVAGPHPYPTVVRYFQEVIGREARAQHLTEEGRLPDAAVACVGGGSNAIGLFSGFLEDPGVALWGVEAAGEGIAGGRHAATLSAGRVGVLHGSKSYVLTDEDGQILHAHSISAGLDYPGVGPEHAFLKDSGRARYVAITDDEALVALRRLAETEGILCALETAHALAHAERLAKSMGPNASIVVNCSGRGDKDMDTVAAALGVTLPGRGR